MAAMSVICSASKYFRSISLSIASISMAKPAMTNGIKNATHFIQPSAGRNDSAASSTAANTTGAIPPKLMEPLSAKPRFAFFAPRLSSSISSISGKSCGSSFVFRCRLCSETCFPITHPSLSIDGNAQLILLKLHDTSLTRFCQQIATY